MRQGDLFDGDDGIDLRPPFVTSWTGDQVDVDLFAGGGGWSDGKRRATGRSPDAAVNHWAAAIAMHAENHPDCHHYIEDVFRVRPLEVTKGAKCRLLIASPTCVPFSRAKGDRLSPGTAKIRCQADVIIPWIRETRPDAILVENVVEFLQWGPVCWDHSSSCAGKADDSGDSCSRTCGYGRPIKERHGEYFEAWRSEIVSYGYSFDVRVLKAWEYGAPTTRERAYCVMLADGREFRWPEPTHVRPELAAATGKPPWRTAAEIIDWSIPCPSIFDRATPHVPATRRRLAKGMRKFVLEAAEPFLMHLTHGDRHAPHAIGEPVPTVTAANRGEQAITFPFMIHRSNGERPGQEPRTYDVRAPYPTAVAGGIKTSPVLAFISKAYGARHPDEVQASDLRGPLHAVTGQDHNHLVAISTTKFYGTSTGQDAREPLHTITGDGWKHGVVAASLLRYNGEREHQTRGQRPDGPLSTLDASRRHGLMAASLLRYNGQSVGQQPSLPLGTIDATDRYALAEYPLAAASEWNDVTAAKARRVYQFLLEEGVDGPWMDHEAKVVRLPAFPEFIIYDIGMRMLVPRELFRAQGFAESYVIDLVGPRGKVLTKTEQVRLVGNSVCPDVAAALVRAAMDSLGGSPGVRLAA